MSRADPDIARRAFDTVAAMKRTTSPEALDDLAAEAFGKLQLSSFALARFFRSSGAADVAVLAGRFDQPWAERYTAHDYASRDRIALELLLVARPYSWEEAMRRRRVSTDQIAIREEARDFGLSDGLFFPIRQTDGSIAAVVLAGRSPELDDPLLRTSAEMLSAYYAAEVQRLSRCDGGARCARLSPRQRECLAWVRMGKSSGVIAEILGISADTVEEHIAGACRKLGVRTRIQAAVEATLAGLFDA